MKNLSYLASPYSHPDKHVRSFRHNLATWTTAKFLSYGVFVYSPLTHNVPLIEHGLGHSWQVWQYFDLKLLSLCDSLIVLKIDGWEQSVGLQAEMEFAAKEQKSILELNPRGKTLEEIQESCEPQIARLSKLFIPPKVSRVHHPFI